MKKLIMTLILASVLSQSCAQKISDAISGATADFAGKNLETKEFTLSDFSRIETSAAIKMTVVKSSARKIVIKSNAMQYVEATVKNGELSVQYNSHGTSMHNTVTEVTVFTPEFSSLAATSASQITVADGFRLGKLSIDVSSAARISGNFVASEILVDTSSAAHFEGTVKANRLNLDASSSSKMNISGEAKTVTADASSTAKINLENLRSNSLHKDESSFGSVTTK